ncbi:MAG: hypothetical protein K6F28_00180 [Lachnospiraceae bacterium]|nr:hypothetical protein [Lachnospiraceae bacterium]
MFSTIVLCGVYLLLAVAGMTFIKSGHNSESVINLSVIGASLSVRTIMGIVFYGLSFMIFVFYVSKLNIGIVIPLISGLNSMAVVIIGYYIFKEQITIGQYIGIAFIILGTVLIGIYK